MMEFLFKSIKAPSAIISIYLFSLIASSSVVNALDEGQRLEQYHLRNYTWPMTYVPATEGWKRLMDRRFAQIGQIEDTDVRYEA